MSHVGTPAPPPDGTFTLPSQTTKPGLSIRSILLIMLLLVSVASSVVVGLIGYVNGRDSLQDAAFERLSELRDSRAREVRALFTTIENSLLVSVRGQSIAEATTAFTAAFDELDSGAALTDEQRATLEAYYTDTFGPRLAEATGSEVDATTFVPTGTAQAYLAYHYTAPFTEFADAVAVDDAGDGSTWSAVHSQYHDFFRRMAELYQLEDVLLIDTSGNIVYTTFKGIDLGANLDAGPLERTNLAEAYTRVLTSNVPDTVVFTDFAPYPPSLENPAAWGVAPVAVDGTIIGAIAIELPISRIDEVMAAGGEQSGLGRTGETYLVGADDKLMRSNSRSLVEDPDQFAARSLGAGTPASIVDRAVETGSTLLLQPVRTDAVTQAAAGNTGTTVSTNYLGETTIAASAPLDIEGLDWVIVAEVDAAEAFEPVDDFTRNLVLSSAIIVLAVSLLSLVIAGAIVRPLRRLRDAARKIAAGETGVQVDVGTSDELADVGAAFNDMSRSLQVKESLLAEQQAENERLLLSLMPEPLARKYREGQRTIAFDHQEVTVLFADIVGFEAFSRGKSSEAALEHLNEIIRSFDEAGDRLGVERVRTTRAGYLASCGLTVPRVDNARRMVEFAIETHRILRRLGAKYGADLQLRAGLDTGTVTSGLVGQSHIAYDLWGDAVTLAYQVQATEGASGIFLTQAVVDRMPDTVHVRDWGVVATPGGPQRVWRIDPGDLAD